MTSDPKHTAPDKLAEVERVAKAIAEVDPGDNPAQSRLYARAALTALRSTDEVGKIVEWLRNGAHHGAGSVIISVFRNIADRIERREYLTPSVPAQSPAE